jgi:undecaprenyl diphosphate synthase
MNQLKEHNLKDLNNISVSSSDKTHGVKHLAIIMDGNRRWAKSKGMPSIAGHREGVKTLKKTLRYCKEIGIKYLTVYVFSTENWARAEEEVKFLFDLLKQVLREELKDLIAEGGKLKFIGDIASLNEGIKQIIQTAESQTATNESINLQIAFNYGSKAEITQAARSIAEKVQKGEIKIDEINEGLIEEHLYTRGIPHPDLLIRTGGEQRISNYLLWQIAYTELYFTDVFWPQFTKKDLKKAIIDFNKRERKYGKR